MGQIMRLRVILDTEEDVFRDIDIAVDAPLMHLHFAILDAFGWEAGELASFFQSDEAWTRGKEFSLLDMSDTMADEAEDGEMAENTIGHLIPSKEDRAIYVYDFLRMWCFYVEPLSVSEPDPDGAYPALCHEFGTPPAFDSKDADLLDGMDLDVGAPAADEGPLKTGDPELDAYLAGDDDDDDEFGGDHLSIDDIQDIY